MNENDPNYDPNPAIDPGVNVAEIDSTPYSLYSAALGANYPAKSPHNQLSLLHFGLMRNGLPTVVREYNAKPPLFTLPKTNR